jgi:predicted nucleotidyltransferase
VSVAAPTQREETIVAAIHATLGNVPVVLCGSRATGTSTPASDYDLLVPLPSRLLPLAIRRLRGLTRALAQELAAPVSINPLPLSVLRKRPNLFIWKLAKEARVLYPDEGFALPAVAAPPFDDCVRFSYLMTALLQLLTPAGTEATTDSLRERKAHKALLHVAQLRLMADGRYAVTLESAIQQLGDEQLDRLTRLDGDELWSRTLPLVVGELKTLKSRSSIVTTLRTNARYVLLAALRGRLRLRAAASLTPIDRRLAEVAIELAYASEGLQPDPARVEAARARLPRSLHRTAIVSWKAIRDVVLEEWPDAHPLLAQ